MNQLDFLGLAPRGIFDTGWQGPRPYGMPSLQMARGVGDGDGGDDSADESSNSYTPVKQAVTNAGGGGGGGGGGGTPPNNNGGTSYTTPILVGVGVLAAGGLAYAILKKR